MQHVHSEQFGNLFTMLAFTGPICPSVLIGRELSAEATAPLALEKALHLRLQASRSALGPI